MPPSNAPLPKIDEIIRSKRNSFSLEIKPDGRLIMRVPETATEKQVIAIVAQKAAWIRQTQAKVAKRFPTAQPKNYTPGDVFWYLGEQYPLQLTSRKRPSLELDGSFLLSRSAQDHAKDVFIKWYREETRQITQSLIEKYVRQNNFKVNQVTITSARTRWGSCSGRNNLNFTYRLSMAPLHVIEYVVVHELAHLKVRNHSSAFWQEVNKLWPDYQRDRKWLRQHGPLLTLD
jgi:predicted metal-dependent hydrolase